VRTASIIKAMMEAVRTSETFVNFNMTTQRYIPEYFKLHPSNYFNTNGNVIDYDMQKPNNTLFNNLIRSKPRNIGDIGCPITILVLTVGANSVAQEPEGSSPYSQQLATGPYPEPVESNPPRTQSPSILIPSSHLCLGLLSGLFPSGFPNKTLYNFLSSSMRATCPAHLTPQ
jgi:hypothetical protein